MMDAFLIYKERYEIFLQDIAIKLRDLLQEYLFELSHIDRITARAKTPDSFFEKISRTNEDGSFKYNTPLTDIQDQIGARVIVFYKDDIDVVHETIKRYFNSIEEIEKTPDSFWEFGYFGLHMIIPLPRDVIPSGVEVTEVPKFFELQIKTLFQHAWSESNHDLGYKPESNEDLNQDQIRRLAFCAAQAWGADHVLQDLYQETKQTEKDA